MACTRRERAHSTINTDARLGARFAFPHGARYLAAPAAAPREMQAQATPGARGQAAPLELVQRKNLDFAHSPLSADEAETIDTILAADPNCDVLVTPNHHIDADGVLHGFRVAYPPHATDIMLPVNREMFFGHTIVEASSSTTMNADVMRLAADPEHCRALMRELLAEIDAASSGKVITAT